MVKIRLFSGNFYPEAQVYRLEKSSNLFLFSDPFFVQMLDIPSWRQLQDPSRREAAREVATDRQANSGPVKRVVANSVGVPEDCGSGTGPTNS